MADDFGRDGLGDAAEEVLQRYEKADASKSGKHFTYLEVCLAGNFFIVYRVPGGDAFDAWINKVARRHKVGVRLADTRYSAADWAAVRKTVQARLYDDRSVTKVVYLVRMDLEMADGGYLDVGVHGDVEEARRILADLGDRVRIVDGAKAPEG